MRYSPAPKRHAAAAFYSALLQSSGAPVDLVDALTYSTFTQLLKARQIAKRPCCHSYVL